MEIRNTKESDLKELSKIFSESFTAADPEKPWTEKSAYNLLAYYLQNQSEMFLVAIDEGGVTGGAAALIKPWRDGNRIVEAVLFVDPNRQNFGVGKKLFKKMLKKGNIDYNAQFIEGVTFASDFPLNWYERIGFKRNESAIFIKGHIPEMIGNL